MSGRILLVFLASALLGTSALAADKVTPEYLVGTWSLEGPAACGKADGEYLTFSGDGGFHAYQGGRLRATGFWHLADQYLEFYVVSSAAIIDPELDEYVGYFSMAEINALETKVEKNRLELAVRLEERLDHWKLDRCKQ
jgi:hypothetical protein